MLTFAKQDTSPTTIVYYCLIVLTVYNQTLSEILLSYLLSYLNYCLIDTPCPERMPHVFHYIYSTAQQS